MNRRLLKTANGSGLYEVTHPEIGSWLEWQRLPPRDTTDPATSSVRRRPHQGLRGCPVVSMGIGMLTVRASVGGRRT